MRKEHLSFRQQREYLNMYFNLRKELIQCGVLDPEKDLYLGKLALTKFPKSPETWIHRRWVLHQTLTRLSAADSSGKQNPPEAEQADVERNQQLNYHLTQMFHTELNVCSDAACSYPSNYNAWSHRIWVLQHMAKGNVEVFHDELSTMRQWVSMHVSDHSGFHYRQFLLKELIDEFSLIPAPNKNCSDQYQSRTVPRSWLLRSINVNAFRQQPGIETMNEDDWEPELARLFELFHQEMELCSDLIRSFPGHETLWSHRRHVFYLWHQWRWEHQVFYLNRNGSTVLNNIDDTTRLKPGTEDCGEWGAGTMEVDGRSFPVPSDSKRLKRGFRSSNLPSLSSECTFLSTVLERQCNPEQRHFGLAYKKWLDSVIGKVLEEN
ncbi:protein prenyltransferase alpha subunit repeat-containing protein 1 isoform X3 [Syngnathoides biaculeatus]|uniref:protein prenyltransferase alpha subunit repeat-containing protein 1 isoform X3 n=1 Tax=Syngnathoides biaculeatus TaxID=300417 RepID=UPI002ADE0F3D|nr:protein prenyltransferase alpha subunit repeat-containing protein 1 isoform X3 [Syngnathoides biaculeatus]XP_061672902.1 protein prenyltransferase alpha subunit repeat-containing protein 1 isoform X3 [Syngnathoides biaculeatus]XP_061672903.1 protein prenyltransferase alpha subunit repeat-containing protein 1 isoform X3 [Syngnathoides biaculeatus]XP_061672905.1 protein prenyltransferase alpha subunit repeat-containing protein 1 isoform X3 [Syngnathoides biaculeatus]